MLRTVVKMCTPTKSYNNVGLTLYANENVIIEAGETEWVRLGVCVDLKNIPQIKKFKKEYYLELYLDRSLKLEGLTSNPEPISLEQKDEIEIIINKPIQTINCGMGENGMMYKEALLDDTFTIKRGDKIAQILLKEHKTYLMETNAEEC